MTIIKNRISYSDITRIINTVTNKVIDINGNYTPECRVFYTNLSVLVTVTDFEFTNDEIPDDLYDKVEIAYKEFMSMVEDNTPKYFNLTSQIIELDENIGNKIEFEKEKFLKNSSYSLTDMGLSKIVDKISDFVDKAEKKYSNISDKELETFMDNVNQIGKGKNGIVEALYKISKEYKNV